MGGMSYSIRVVCPECGHEVSEWNYTSNCAAMWRAAGADLAAFDGKRAHECVPILAKAIAVLKTEPERFVAMNPPNGWGSYATLVPALEELLLQLAVSGGHVRVSR